MSKMYSNQKIKCNVVDCVHNCVSDCTCRLEQIKVCPCTNEKYAKSEEGTACASYHYAGDLNEKENMDYNS